MKQTITSKSTSLRAAVRMVGVIVLLALAAGACSSDSDQSSTITATTEAATSEAVSESSPAVEDSTSGSVSGDGVDIDLFVEGALAGEIVTVDCTLASGTETSCYQITVAGYPADNEVGPFCPTTTSDTADQVGIWLDGENLYDIDGQFILDLSEIYGDDNWQLHDDDGHVHVTDTQEAFEGAARPDVAEEYQNHCVEGQIAWLDNGEPITSTVEIPVTPVASESVTQAGQSLGVTLNGVIIAGEAPIAAILGAYTIAAFDDCGGHINPFDGYHLHGATGCSEVGDAAGGETPVFAIALDGYAIHSPLEDADVADADVDQCNGHRTDELGYHYHANNPEDNAVLSCFTGQTTARADVAGGPGGDDAAGNADGGGPGGPPDGPGGAPDFTDAANALGVSAQDLTAALGQPPFDLDAAAAALAVTVADLEAALPAPPVRGGQAPEQDQSATAATADTAADVDAGELAIRSDVARAALWANNVDITIDGSTLIFESDGLPAHEYLDVYLGDGRDGKFIAGGVDAYTARFEIPLVPVLASAPSETGNGAIGVAISGAVFFDPYEGNGSATVANDDNETIDGIPFIDACGGHPLPNGMSYHYHGIPFCITDAIDTPGQHSIIIGYLFDGYPIYGPQDSDGEEPTDLDACLGHTGATPEFETATYHYHVTSTANYISECLAGIT